MFNTAMNRKWGVIKTGAGVVVGYVEMFWTGKMFVTIPGASRCCDSDGVLIEEVE